jgi:hypothetical protein
MHIEHAFVSVSLLRFSGREERSRKRRARRREPHWTGQRALGRRAGRAFERDKREFPSLRRRFRSGTPFAH